MRSPVKSFRAKKGGELTAAELLLCGPPALIAAARSTLLALGAEAAKILVEDFGV